MKNSFKNTESVKSAIACLPAGGGINLTTGKTRTIINNGEVETKGLAVTALIEEGELK
jgi:hypothetical protein